MCTYPEPMKDNFVGLEKKKLSMSLECIHKFMEILIDHII